MALKRKTFDDLITFTRASVKNVFGSDGLLQEVAVDKPAFQYNPATGIAEGILIEGQETNSLLWNRDLSNAVWTSSGSPTFVQNAVGLDGVANSAWTVTDASITVTGTRRQLLTVPNDSQTHTVAFPIKKNSGDEANGFPVLELGLSGGTIVRRSVSFDTRDGSSALVSGVTNSGSHTVFDAGSYWIVYITVTNNSTGNTTLAYNPYPAGTKTLGGVFDVSATGSIVYDYGGVRLNSTFIGSPIKTAGSAVTRSADVATGAIGDEFNAEEFSAVVQGMVPSFVGGGASNQIFGWSDGSANNRIELYVSTSGDCSIFASSGGVSQGTTVGPAVAAGSEIKVAIRIKNDDVAFSVNGASIVNDASFTLPSGLTIRDIGKRYDGIIPWNSTIKSITEYPRALTDAELIAESTL